jgi:exodeoxyribonuclease V beta subunit
MSLQVLNALECPLAGVNLIEASAGTGKTWTIAALYLRLLLEEVNGEAPPGIDSLLVVTYTKAATAELRERLRQQLTDFLEVLQGRQQGSDFLQALAQRFAPGAARDLAVLRLQEAITGFDGAAIYTIHGFCQRVLTDAAFESGQTFAAELVSDDDRLLVEVVDDFWRRRVVTSPLLSQVLAEAGETPDGWLAEIRPWLAKPYLQMVMPVQRDLQQALQEVERCWQQLAADAVTLQGGFDLLLATEGFKATSHSRVQLESSMAELQQWLAEPDSLPILGRDALKRLDKLRPEALVKAMKKGFVAPEHLLFQRIGDWLAAWDGYLAQLQLSLAGLKLELIAWVNEELARRRSQERVRSFDDLLTELGAALAAADGGTQLAAAVARSFRVALIDEFQDTDPIQYDIFRSCFALQGRPLFLVGDPKQAIYSFRGADIFAYLDARQDAPAAQQYSLDTNRRSDVPLVEVVNQLFGRVRPFLLDAISYQPVHAAPSSGAVLEVADEDAAFTVLWQPPEGDKPQNKDSAARASAQGCAHEIARLLTLAGQDRAAIIKGDQRRPLRGGDIAVLVSTHRQGEQMRQALAERGVASVALTQESVFASHEAAELLALLRAWAEPASESRLRAALVTELYGLDAARLLAEVEDETQWEVRLLANAADHQRWLEQGFMSAWRHFLAREQLPLRLLPLPDGERRLTNLSHLAELLQSESDSRHGMAPLLAWLEGRVASPSGGEDAMLRLESDAALVKIVTIHTSKGLQYPVVFCPYLWDGALERRNTSFWRYRKAGQAMLSPDVLADAAVRQQAGSEMLAEKLRLLYVALTRAQHRQYLAWGWVKDMQTAALSWLLHAADCPDLASLRELEFSPAMLQQQLAALASRLPVALHLRQLECGLNPLPLAQDARQDYSARLFQRPVYSPWRVASFTSLTHGRSSKANERPDHDGGLPELSADGGELLAVDSPFAFPRGARAGTCLHAMFENIDFGMSDAQLQPVVAQQLRRHGFADSWQPAALQLLRQTLDAELAPGVRLADVPAGRKLVEMEFTLPVRQLDVAALRRVLTDPANGLAQPLRTAAAGLDFRTVRGYLKGFVDLVFEADGLVYLVDYKSNHLGEQATDYATEPLLQSVAREHYYLQYLIYCVALRRYFSARGRDFAACFGGVRYLYLRGMGMAGMGIWHDQPAQSLLAELDGLLR